MTIACPFCDGLGVVDLWHSWPSWRGDSICLQCDGEGQISLCVSILERGPDCRGEPWFGETARDLVDVDDYVAKAVFGTAVAPEDGPLLDALRAIWAEDDALAGERAKAVDEAMERERMKKRVRRVQTIDFRTPEQKFVDDIFGRDEFGDPKPEPPIDYVAIGKQLARLRGDDDQALREEADRLEAAAGRARKDWTKRKFELAAKSIRLNLEHARAMRSRKAVAPLT